MNDILTPVECKTALEERRAGKCSAISLKLANRMLATIDALAEALKNADLLSRLPWVLQGEPLEKYDAVRSRVAAWLE